MQRSIAFALIVLLAVLTLPTARALADDTILRLRADLDATEAGDDARGEAEWKQDAEDDNKTRERFRVDVQDVPTDGDGQVIVVRYGAVVFQAEIEIEDGDGRLELDTDDGDYVPILAAGDTVKVLDADGVLVLSGVLKKD